MKVKCMKCRSDMPFPFFKCNDCGWETKGRYRKRSELFASRHIKMKGNDPKLKRKFQNAKKGISEEDLIWKASTKGKKEPRVRCKKCHDEMIFPFLECGSCGWIARRELRACSLEFVKIYIMAHPGKEEVLDILWTEENKRLSKK